MEVNSGKVKLPLIKTSDNHTSFVSMMNGNKIVNKQWFLSATFWLVTKSTTVLLQSFLKTGVSDHTSQFVLNGQTEGQSAMHNAAY